MKFINLSLKVTLVSILLGLTSPSIAAHHKTDEMTAKEVKQKASETLEALKKYTIEQKNDAINAAKKQMAELDKQISSLQVSMDEQWDEMSQATKQAARESLNTIREQREDLAQWYGGMRYSSEEAWSEVINGFSESYQRLGEAFVRAQEEFNSQQKNE